MIARERSNASALLVVVTCQIIKRDTNRLSADHFGEIENLHGVDANATHTAAHLKRIDARIEEVAEELRPGSLLCARGVPNSMSARDMKTTAVCR